MKWMTIDKFIPSQGVFAFNWPFIRIGWCITIQINKITFHDFWESKNLPHLYPNTKISKFKPNSTENLWCLEKSWCLTQTLTQNENSLKILVSWCLQRTSRCREVGFGIWLLNTTSPQHDVCYIIENEKMLEFHNSLTSQTDGKKKLTIFDYI